MGTRGGRDSATATVTLWWHHDFGPAWALAGAKVALHAAVAWRHGFHRDELYYVVGGRNPDWGYVDHPPIVPFVARAVTDVAGLSVWALRLVPAVLGAATLLVAAWTARRLGGGRTGSTLAALAVLTSPLYLGANAMYQTPSWDFLAGTLVTALLVHLLLGGAPRTWLLLGAVIGVGVEAKWTFLIVVFGSAVGILATDDRRLLARPEPWLGAMIALVLAAPNLVWQTANGWPTIEFAANNNDANAADNGPVLWVLLTLLFVGPHLVVLVGLGLRRLLTHPPLRSLGIGAVVSTVLMLVLRAKPYYVGSWYPLLYAAGAVVVAERVRASGPRVARVTATWAVVGGLACVPFTLAVLPTATLREGSPLLEVNPDLGEQVGWRELADVVVDAAGRNGAEVVLTSDYGEAAAIELFRPDGPVVVSGHNSYTSWGDPAALAAEPVLVVGYSVESAQLHEMFDRCRVVGRIESPGGVANDADGTVLQRCEDLRVPSEVAWDRLRHYR